MTRESQAVTDERTAARVEIEDPQECWCYIEHGELIAEECCPVHGDQGKEVA